VFQEIEAAGGAVKALADGKVQAMVGETAAARRKSLSRRKDVLVGTNQYANAQEPAPAFRPLDHAALHRRRAQELQELRTSGQHQADVDVLKKLEGILAGAGPQIFPAIVEAAAAGATVGELSRTFRHDADPDLRVAPIAAWRAGELFEKLRLAVQAHPDRDQVTVFGACLGDVARYMPRLDFTRGFFQAGGFTVQADRYFASAAEAAAAAKRSGAATAVIVGRDETYAEQAADTARALKDAGVQTVLLAGLPADLEDALQAAGVDQFIHVRSDCHAVLSDLARTKGVAL